MSDPDNAGHPVIREATAADSSAIAELITQLGYRTEPGDMAHRLEGILGHPGYATYVAELHEEVVGVVGVCVAPYYEREGLYGQVVVLSVHSKYQRLGVGRSLLGAAEHWARRQGANAVVVNSGRQRNQAHAFYERVGYSPTGIRFVKELRRHPTES
jgi:GNAT superfamily N-acetyltransferase